MILSYDFHFQFWNELNNYVFDCHLQMQEYTYDLVRKSIRLYAFARAFKLSHMKLSMEAMYPQPKLKEIAKQRYLFL